MNVDMNAAPQAMLAGDGRATRDTVRDDLAQLERVPQLKPTVFRPRGASQPLAMLCC